MKKILPLTMILYAAALPAADSFTETMRAIHSSTAGPHPACQSSA